MKVCPVCSSEHSRRGVLCGSNKCRLERARQKREERIQKKFATMVPAARAIMMEWHDGRLSKRRAFYLVAKAIGLPRRIAERVAVDVVLGR